MMPIFQNPICPPAPLPTRNQLKLCNLQLTAIQLKTIQLLLFFGGLEGGGGNHLLIIDSYQCHLSVNWRLWGRQ